MRKFLSLMMLFVVSLVCVANASPPEIPIVDKTKVESADFVTFDAFTAETDAVLTCQNSDCVAVSYDFYSGIGSATVFAVTPYTDTPIKVGWHAKFVVLEGYNDTVGYPKV